MPASAEELRPSSRLLVNGILAATARLVREAMQGDWRRATAVSLHRRVLLDKLGAMGLEGEQAAVIALRQAVAESDRALAVMSPRRVAVECRPMLG